MLSFCLFKKTAFANREARTEMVEHQTDRTIRALGNAGNGTAEMQQGFPATEEVAGGIRDKSPGL